MKSIVFIFDLDNTLLATNELSERHPGRLYDFIRPDYILQKLLLKIPNEKWILTNGNRQHANTSLKKLGIHKLFRGQVDRDSCRYMKPDPYVYNLLSKHCKKEEKIFFDDMIENLEEAKRQGWITVLILPGPRLNISFIDLHFPNIYEALYFFLLFQHKSN